MQRSIIIVAIVALLAIVVSAENRGLSAHFTADTKTAFKASLTSAQPFSSLASAALGVSALQRLGETVAHKADLCTLASNELTNEKPQSVESIYYASELRQALACSGAKQASKGVVDVLRTAVDEASSVSHLLYASKALLALHKASLLPPNSFKPADLSVVIAHVAEAFASELSIEAYGHGFSAAAIAASTNADSLSETDETSLDVIAEAVGDVLGRGIELEDGSVVFYDSGDSSTAPRATAALLSGITAIAAAKSDIDLPSDLSSAVGDYFVSRSVPNSVADIAHLLTIIEVVTGAQLANPLALSVTQQSLSSGSKEDIRVTVADIWGKLVSGSSVYLLSVTKEGAAKPLLSNQPLVTSSTPGEFSLNLLGAKPDAGLYTLQFSATAPANSKFATITATTRRVQITIPISVSEIEFQVLDSTDGEVSLKRTLTETSKLDSDVEALYYNNLYFGFSLRAANSKSSKGLAVQQVFLSLTNTATNEQVVFPAQPTAKGYAVTLELRNEGRALNFRSGVYHVALFVADSFIENPVNRDLGSIKLSFQSSLEIAAGTKAYGTKKPDIAHKYREPDSRPPASFSLAFTGITLAPIAVLLIGILAVGFNLSGIPSNPLGLLGSLVLIASVAAVAFLYVEFFLVINIFDTLKYLGVISSIAVVAGKYAFRSRAAARKSKKE